MWINPETSPNRLLWNKKIKDKEKRLKDKGNNTLNFNLLNIILAPYILMIILGRTGSAL